MNLKHVAVNLRNILTHGFCPSPSVFVVIVKTLSNKR